MDLNFWRILFNPVYQGRKPKHILSVLIQDGSGKSDMGHRREAKRRVKSFRQRIF